MSTIEDKPRICPPVHKGLAGVVVDTTAISKVVPETNSLTYRGYAVQDLAAHCSFEQVAYLLWHGELPDDQQLALFSQRERAARRLNRSMLSVLAKLPDTCHPMDVVRTLISYMGAEDSDEDDSSPRANYAKSLRMFAVLPTIVAADMRRRRGLEPIAPHSHMNYAQNFLHMCFGDVPEQVVVDAFEQSMVLYAEHSFNTSTFAARVVTSTQSDIYSAVTAAIGALKGPLHGGANEAVMHDTRNRHRRKSFRMAAGQAVSQRQGHGFRPPGIQERRLTRADNEKGSGTCCRGSRRSEVARHLQRPRAGHAGRHRNQTESGLSDRAGISPDGLRHRLLHTNLRDEPDHRMDRPHHRADRVQRIDPSAERVRRRTATCAQIDPVTRN